MVRTDFKLETVTPMFLHGHDNQTVELRPPPFKALLRYWWRTVQDSTEDSLRKDEANRFGSTDGKAPFFIRIPGKTKLTQTKCKPLPHKPDNDRFGKKIDAIDKGQSFELSLITQTPKDAIYYQEVAKLGFLLGGVGARSRRGFGSLRDTSWTFSNVSSLQTDILKTLNAVAKVGRFRMNKYYDINGRSVEVIESKRWTHFPPKFPVIQRIFFGKPSGNLKALLEKIGQKSSVAKKCNKDDTLGGGVPRMASPVIVRIQTVNSQYIPIVTQLFSPYPMSKYTGRHEQRKPSDMQNKQLKFIDSIIK